MSTNKVECLYCGNTTFRKLSSTSCSEVPPIFVCLKCDKCQPMKINKKLDPRYNNVISDKDNHFMGHLKCFVCGKENFDDWNLQHVPAGWIVKNVEILDPSGNIMLRKYAYCPNHRP